MKTSSLEAVRERDRSDPLGSLRSKFDPAPEPIYMDGNSLGRPPIASIEAVQRLLSRWREELVSSWSEWIDWPTRLGDRLAPLVGAGPDEVLVCDSTTVNLYKCVRAALSEDPGRRVLVGDASDFPTDRYLLEGIATETDRSFRLVPFNEMEGPQPEVLAENLAGDVAVVVLSHVNYRSGALCDMRALTRTAHEAGALVVFDLSHSVGAVPIDLEGSGVDMAVGCTYKYLNGGPGCPAFLYVRREHQHLLQPLWGWFGRKDQFRMGPGYDPAGGITRYLAGTPPIVSMATLEASLSVIEEATIPEIRRKGAALTEMMLELHDSWLAAHGVTLGTPRDPDRRGAHVAFRHEHGYRISRALIERHGVIPDFREPDIVRYGVSSLYTRYEDVWQAMTRFRACLEERTYEEFDGVRSRIT